ncbi:ABC transporter permease [Methylobacterium sp. P5_C11]
MSTGTPIAEATGLAAPAGTPALLQEPGTLAAFWRRLRARKSAVAGLIIVGLLILMAVFAPWIAPYDPTATDWGNVRGSPSLAHPFGGDEVGRDVLSRIIYGARASLGAGLVSVALAVSLGLPLGLLAGYAGGWIDGAISRLTDALLAIPFLILAIALAAFLGPSLVNAMIAIGLSATSTFIRLTRAQVRAVAAEEFVEAARAMGNPPWRIARVHILPNIVPAILVQATLTIAAAIIAEASLSFLGLGQQPPEPSWGAMLNTAKNFMDEAPWMAIWPGLSIFLAVLAFNLFGDGLRDALDPRQRT